MWFWCTYNRNCFIYCVSKLITTEFERPDKCLERYLYPIVQAVIVNKPFPGRWVLSTNIGVCCSKEQLSSIDTETQVCLVLSTLSSPLATLLSRDGGNFLLIEALARIQLLINGKLLFEQELEKDVFPAWKYDQYLPHLFLGCALMISNPWCINQPLDPRQMKPSTQRIKRSRRLLFCILNERTKLVLLFPISFFST